ncbi:aldolase [Zopfia rhizophila CBS 207.26]|uniref:Aldolase n=1 Tax=Zopfia rhizophila CBS 207.26 TaxID=1314779 RepID=A0A6A6DE50_9PEZI|nr:aldolase [Zopfia rhizophila CBS 207.26]
MARARLDDKSATRPLETISHRGPTLTRPPTFPDFAAERRHRLCHLATTFRHWSREGYVFGFSGHVSYRDPEYPHAFWTNPLGVHFGLLKASDMVLVNLYGEIIGGNRSRPANTAGFLIHAAVHKARPDVHAACHCHSPAGKAWSAVGRHLDMITQGACKFLGDAHAVYDSYGRVVLAAEEGNRIARALGPHGKGCLAVEAAVAGNNVTKVLISDEQTKDNFNLEADPSYCYAEFQVYYDYEDYMSKGDFKL